MDEIGIGKDNRGEGFTRFLNKVLNALLITDLTKRELKTAILVGRLTYGCNRRWAKLLSTDLNAIGIRDSHAAEVLKPLLTKQIIVQNGKTKEYRLNEEYLTLKVTEKGSFRLVRFNQLIGKQLQKNSSRYGNKKVTELVSDESPKGEFPTYQNGKNSKRGLASVKDIIKYKYKDSDRNTENADLKTPYKTGKDSDITPDPNSLIPTTEQEYTAKSIWLQVEPDHPESFAFYMYAAKEVQRDALYRFVSEIKQDPLIKNKGAVFVSKVKDYLKQSE